MKLSAPIYNLKRRAKSLARQLHIPRHAALDKIAREEGFRNWSHLASSANSSSITNDKLEQFVPGELILLGARPGHGKTRLAVEHLADSIILGKHGWFFTLEWTRSEFDGCLQQLGKQAMTACSHFHFDGSDSICSDYMIERLARAKRGTVVVIDYLQILDQKRSNPDLATQLCDLKAFVKKSGISTICISQINRNYDESRNQTPSLGDIRLPNPLDLTVFDRACFLQNGRLEYTLTRS